MVLISVLMVYLFLYQIFNTILTHCFDIFVYLCINNNSKIILLGQSNF